MLSNVFLRSEKAVRLGIEGEAALCDSAVQKDLPVVSGEHLIDLLKRDCTVSTLEGGKAKKKMSYGCK